METTITYRLGTRTADDLRSDIDAFWAEVDRNVSLQRQIADAGIQDDELEQLKQPNVFRFREEGAGFDETTIDLIVSLTAFAPIVNHAAETLWDEVVLPWIRRRWGDDAVRSRKSKRNDD